MLVPDYDEGLSALKGDKADAFLADAPIIKLTAMRYPDAGYVQLDTPLTIEPIGIALPPNDPPLINLIENYLRAVEAAGGIDALRKKCSKAAPGSCSSPDVRPTHAPPNRNSVTASLTRPASSRPK